MSDWEAAEAWVESAVSWQAHEPGGGMILFDDHGIRVGRFGGVENLSTSQPFGIGTVVRYASVTKHVFAAFVLAQGDVLSLDDPLGKHLPRLSEATARITVGQALDMSGGVPDTRECLTLTGHSIFTQTLAPDLLALHERLAQPSYPSGTEVHYSNGGYRLVEEALRGHGRLFADFVRDHLGAELNLTMFAPEFWTDPVPGLCNGYWRDGETWRMGLQGMHLSGAGSLCGSAGSLAHWGGMLLKGAEWQGGLLGQLTAPRRLADGRVTDYGLGLRRQRVGGRDLVGHGGSQPGFKSYLLLDTDSRTGCVVVANRDDVNAAGLAAGAMAALLGQTLPQPFSDLRPGVYVSPAGDDWLEVRAPNSVIRLDDEAAVYSAGDGPGIDSMSATSSLRLQMEGDMIVGEVGHAPARFEPAVRSEIPSDLDGHWINDESGAVLSIKNGQVFLGNTAVPRPMPLWGIGNGLMLFDLVDGPWTRRICLRRQDNDRLVLSLSRARQIAYRRMMSGD